MASRAEVVGPAHATRPVAAGSGLRVTAADRVGVLRAVRLSLTDFYFASLRLVAVNLAWGAVAVAVVVLALGTPVAGLALLPLLAVPTAAVYRAAGRIVRAGSRSASGDDLAAHALPLLDRRLAGRALGFGVVIVAAGALLVGNAVTGLGRADPPGWALATLAAWGLIGLAGIALVGWPVIVDPLRADRPVREDLAAIAAVLLLHPGRVLRLALVTAAILALSIALTAAVLTVGIAFAALVGCRTVYPLAEPAANR